MNNYRVVTDRYYTGTTDQESQIKEESFEVEADGFAVDGTGTLFFFENTPDVQITNPDGQALTRSGQPKPVRAFAKDRWIDVARA
jgi:sugar lactone lactonase YvrE